MVGATRQHADAATIGGAVVIGAGFGLLFIAYSEAGADGGLWPLLTSRFGGIPLLAIAYVLARRRGSAGPVSRSTLRPAMAIGVMVGLANGLYLLSTREGLLSVVAVIVSLYPASTIALAIALDHERASRSQLVGMGLAMVAVAAVTLGS
jgi:drug/metabolite transporter (DMT)-like permease